MNTMPPRPTRRRFLQLAAAGLPAAAAAATGARPGPAGAQGAPAVGRPAFDWKRHAGRTLRVLGQDNHLWAELVGARRAEFTDLTGIELKLDLLPDVRKQTSLEFPTGSSTADVFVSTLSQDGIRFLAARYYTDLKPLVENPTLTSPEFAFGDFTPRIMESGIQGGVTVGIPLWTECVMLCYHKDLLRQAGVGQAPTEWTFADLEAAAAAVRKLRPDTYGVAFRGSPVQVAGIWSVWLHSFGGSWVDKDGHPALGTPQAVAALEAFGRVVRESGPPNATALDWSKSREFLLQNKAAVWVDSSALMPLDPAKFAPLERFGYARTPAGPTGLRSPSVYSWVAAIYNGSRNKEAAWLFIQWATSPRMQLELARKGLTPSRRSVYDTAEFRSAMGDRVPDFVQATRFAVEQGHGTWLPPFVNVLEARDVVGRLVQAAINGATGPSLREAVDRTQARLVRIKQESGI
jgi:multiple sugar transport system substrate-binding protein